MPTLILMRGLPGAGKTTWARAHAPRAAIFSADTYFEDPAGVYRYDPVRLAEAHALCTARAIEAMGRGIATVLVDNTHSRRWEWSVIAAAARALRYRLEIVDLFDAGLDDAQLAARTLHAVPSESIAAMRARWEPA